MTPSIRFLSRYGGVAIVTSIADWIAYSLLLFFGIEYFYCQMFSRIIGGIVSFALNRSWTFKMSSGKVSIQGRRFMLLYRISYGLSIFILISFVEKVQFGEYMSKLLADTTIFVFNFIVMKIYVFKDRKGFSSAIVSTFKLKS